MVATREEIREGIIAILEKVRPFDAEEGVAVFLLNYLHSQGVVIRVDREQPWCEAYGEYDCALELAGYVAVEPLIEEK